MEGWVEVRRSLNYCIHGYYRGGLIFVNFVSQTSQKFPLQYMSIYSRPTWKHKKNHKIKPLRISPPFPKSQKYYLCTKYMAYTVVPFTFWSFTLKGKKSNDE